MVKNTSPIPAGVMNGPTPSKWPFSKNGGNQWIGGPSDHDR